MRVGNVTIKARAALRWFLACGTADSFLAFYPGSSCGCWIFEHFIGTGNGLVCFRNYQRLRVFASLLNVELAILEILPSY